MTRSDIVKYILRDIPEDCIVVSSTGFISREVFANNDRPLNFYMMGSMGNALAFGIGIALKVKQKVVVINGDGSALMSLGTFLTAERLRKDNKLIFTKQISRFDCHRFAIAKLNIQICFS